MKLCADINETLRDAEFKDAKPLETVNKIKRILHDNAIETEERWNESGVPYCYSLRVTVCGTTFGANGKGLTKEFALASAYGELMERLQLGYAFQKAGLGVRITSKITHVHAEKLLESNKSWYEYYSKQVAFFCGEHISPQDILKQYTDEDGTVATVPYWNMNTCKTEYFPIKLCRLVYGTNGCAAGNTPEEAIVQALSEIVERKHQTRILTENITTPAISDEVLKKYTVAYGIISYLREKGFRIIVKDCSLGTKFPVVCVCYIEGATGKYHEHFGAYPIFEIALERALTESFQGRNISMFAKFDDFVYDKTSAFPLDELMLTFVKGTSKEKPEFFIGTTEHEQSGVCGFAGQNNKELLKECSAFFTSLGYDILIRDCSCLGFPAYQVLIPGYSEVLVHHLSPKHNAYLHMPAAARVLKNPASANLSDIIAFMTHIERNKKFDRSLLLLQFANMAGLAANTTAREDSKMLAASMGCVLYTLGKYTSVIEYIQQMLPLCEPSEQEYLICLKRYLSLKQHKYEDSQIKALLDMFHQEKTVQGLYACLAENQNPLEQFTLHCDENCDKSCPLQHCCCTKQTNLLANRIQSKMDAMDFDANVKKLRVLL